MGCPVFRGIKFIVSREVEQLISALILLDVAPAFLDPAMRRIVADDSDIEFYKYTVSFQPKIGSKVIFCKKMKKQKDFSRDEDRTRDV